MPRQVVRGCVERRKYLSGNSCKTDKMLEKNSRAKGFRDINISLQTRTNYVNVTTLGRYSDSSSGKEAGFTAERADN